MSLCDTCDFTLQGRMIEEDRLWSHYSEQHLKDCDREELISFPKHGSP